MSKLTDTQLIILSTAGHRDDGLVLPLPKSLKLQGTAVTHVLKSLLKKGLLEEQPTGNTVMAWRVSGDLDVSYEDMLANSGKALELAPRLAEAHASKGMAL